MDKALEKNYLLILKKLADYLPSRILIIINSIVIIPFFAFIMSTKEMSIYQIALETLNLACTCSTDWVSKAALRFYEKYKKQNKLDILLSNLMLIATVVYIAIVFIAAFFQNKFCEIFSLPKEIFYITIFLLIPCGIRQFLYQILRVINRPKLYNFSIFIYQFSLLILFLTLTKVLSNTTAVLTAMTFSMILIDILIIKETSFRFKMTFSIKNSILKEILKYALPLVITNISLWAILNINKFIFQQQDMFLQTAIAGMTWMLAGNIIKPFLTLFLFAVFPLIIHRYELKKAIKPFFTNTIQLYCVLFIPLLSALCYYSKTFVSIFFPKEYSQATIILPFFVISIFLHEFMKLINIKFHLKNKTYIEMLITLFIGIISICANLILIPKFGLIASGLIMLVSISTLISINSAISFKSLNYINLKKITKTLILLIVIGFFTFVSVNLLTSSFNFKIVEIMNILIYILLNYSIIFGYKRIILN